MFRKSFKGPTIKKIYIMKICHSTNERLVSLRYDFAEIKMVKLTFETDLRDSEIHIKLTSSCKRICRWIYF